jgi:hypothetical protein
VQSPFQTEISPHQHHQHQLYLRRRAPSHSATLRILTERLRRMYYASGDVPDRLSE